MGSALSPLKFLHLELIRITELCSYIYLWFLVLQPHSVYNPRLQGLFITIILGIYFTVLQGFKYIEASFTIADPIYGSTFFVATGFNGLHVIIGTIFLITCLLRHKRLHFSLNHHFRFEAAAWYWHFVDVVWLFLYISIYWWGG